MWKTDMGPVGKMDDWIAKDKRGALPPYLTEKVRRRRQLLR
jgi:hypothetical protein